MDPNELLPRCRAGDPLAWEALVRQYQGRVYGIALVYLGQPEEARDLAQDVFVRVYRNLDRCAGGDAFLPWLVRITRNAAIDRLRRMRARPQSSGVTPDEVAQLASEEPGPDEELRRQRRQDLVRRALGRLSHLNREIILLKEIQGLSLETIAAMVKAPLGTVKSRSNRARGELGRALAELMRREPGVEP